MLLKPLVHVESAVVVLARQRIPYPGARAVHVDSLVTHTYSSRVYFVHN